MELREAIESDIPSIVGLLKKSLGEDLLPKSEQYWRWKHIENPFGASPVLLCFDGETLAGVRAFMRWEWRDQTKVYKAVRAVDTATHPDYQGKGIFKKMTTSLVDCCKRKEYDFVFNTPNQKSKPGYLKMGWYQAGRFPVGVKIERPIHILKNLIASVEPSNIRHDVNDLKYYLTQQKLEVLLNYNQPQGKITTNVSLPYLIWRYMQVPVVRYEAIGDELRGDLTGLIIGRIKQSRFGREFRITDCFLSEGANPQMLCKKFKDFKKENAIDYTTFSALEQKYRTTLDGFNFKIDRGPTVTIRSLCLNDLHSLENFNEWAPSLGDLELF